MNFRLLGDRVAVVADEIQETTASGLFVTDSGQDVLRYGTIAAVGSGHMSDYLGAPVAPDIEAGDRVFFHRLSGQPLTIDEEEYVILGQNEIIGVVHNS